MTVWTRIKLAFAAFFSILFKGELPGALQPAAPAAAPSQPAPIDTHDRAVQMLALLQREQRCCRGHITASHAPHLLPSSCAFSSGHVETPGASTCAITDPHRLR